MSPVVKQEPTNARDAAIQQWMKEKGRLPGERYPGNWSGLNQQETRQLSKLIQDYEKTDPRYWNKLQKFSVK